MGIITEKIREARRESHEAKRLAFVSTWWTDALLVTHIPLGNGLEALIDQSDFNAASRFFWHAHKSVRKNVVKYYAEAKVPKSMQHSLGGASVSLHRLLMEFPDTEVDHEDGNGLNCVRRNMRVATRSQNSANRRYVNKTGFRGVCSKDGKYVAQVRHEGKNRHYGRYDTPFEAAMRYNTEAARLFGEFAILNEVQSA
jgi:hypothetical protein